MPERCVPQAVNFPPTRWLILAFSPESDWCFLETMIISYTCRGEALNVIVCLRVLVRTLFLRIIAFLEINSPPTNRSRLKLASLLHQRRRRRSARWQILPEEIFRAPENDPRNSLRIRQWQR